MKNKAKKITEITFEDALVWYDALPCEAKKIVKTSLTMYHTNSNAYVPYNKITDMLDWFDYCFQSISKKNKVKWAKGSCSILSRLQTELFPLGDTASLKKAIYNEGKTMPLAIEHLAPEELRKSRLFENQFVYVKKVTSPKQDFLSISNMKDENAVGSKTYYLDLINFETQFINRYDNSNEMIDVDNKVGPFLTSYFTKIFEPNAWRYAFVKTEDPAKLKILNSIIDIEEKPKEKTEVKDSKLDK